MDDQFKKRTLGSVGLCLNVLILIKIIAMFRQLPTVRRLAIPQPKKAAKAAFFMPEPVYRQPISRDRR
ncbi:MAG TPA: hypothetical protein PLF25_07695 [Accumulibacter sp.]|nr:hypothetical protein [Accumulibacter sp.]